MFISIFAFLMASTVGVSTSSPLLAELTAQLSTNDVGFLEAVGRCRASCVDRFARAVMRITERTCKDRPDCFMCWENCEMMYKNWDTWGLMCENTVICFAGCESVCAFYQQPPEPSPETLDWKLTRPLQVKPHLHNGDVEISWGHARPSRMPLFPAAVVYAPFWHSSKSGRWFALPLTLGHHLKMEDGNMILDMDGFMVFILNRHDLLAAEYQPISRTVPTTPLVQSAVTMVPTLDVISIINITEEMISDEYTAFIPQFNPLVLFALAIGTALIVASVLSIALMTGAHVLRVRRRHQFRNGRHYAIRLHGRPGSVKGRPSVSGESNSQTHSHTNLLKVGGVDGSDWNLARGYLNDGGVHTISSSCHYSTHQGEWGCPNPEKEGSTVYSASLGDYAEYAVAVLEDEGVIPLDGREDEITGSKMLKEQLSHQNSFPV